ncbi:alpha/beta fold hydrolase [Herbiconiux sp. L3-i23]|uniref:alpha/beta fold hydrolase n=1 Tax=Herbiconiux sp. L3-i23 TaxID=2905871 RepID=UPI0020709B22|nr:alpha/beta fold hydrolase [Herbiconiux sp. L3-i23]BDI22088.1 hypothetical protein L3i23_08640 [Herbiconiux sp. L3-i23]
MEPAAARPRRRLARGVLALGVAASIAAVSSLSACSAVEAELRDYEQGQLDEPFYAAVDIPDGAAPGDLIRQERIGGAPHGADAWRVVYLTTDLDDRLIAASGIVAVPADDAPEGGRVVLSWAHPTTGAAPRCAPSVGIDPFLLIEGVGDALGAGYAVVATDYPGLGVPGPNSYLVGVTEGHSVLDIARAAKQLDDDLGDGDLGDRLLLWGHSQGGQAALFAAELAATYAPEFDLVATGVAAPAADLGTLLEDDIDDVSGVTIGAYAFQAYSEVYADLPGSDLDTILTPAAVQVVGEMSDLCLLGQNSELHDIATPLIGGFLKASPTETEPWAQMLSANSPGKKALPGPVFIAQGESDELVRPSSTADFAKRQCELGADVTFLPLPDTNHGMVADRALPTLMPWFAAALAGTPKPSTC